jgi:hypothetical protein
MRWHPSSFVYIYLFSLFASSGLVAFSCSHKALTSVRVASFTKCKRCDRLEKQCIKVLLQMRRRAAALLGTEPAPEEEVVEIEMYEGEVV